MSILARSSLNIDVIWRVDKEVLIAQKLKMTLKRGKPGGSPGSASSPWGVCCRKVPGSRDRQISSTTSWSSTPANWTWNQHQGNYWWMLQWIVSHHPSQRIALQCSGAWWFNEQPVSCFFLGRGLGKGNNLLFQLLIIVGHWDPLSWLDTVPFTILQQFVWELHFSAPMRIFVVKTFPLHFHYLMLFQYVSLQGSFPRITSSTELTNVLPLCQVHPVADCVVLYIHLKDHKSMEH